jgi:hypothetical protein
VTWTNKLTWRCDNTTSWGQGEKVERSIVVGIHILQGGLQAQTQWFCISASCVYNHHGENAFPPCETMVVSGDGTMDKIDSGTCC